MLQFVRDRDDLIIHRPEWRNENISPSFDVRIRIKQPKVGEPVDQQRMAVFAEPPDLEVGPVGEINQPVAVAFGEFGDSRRLFGVDPASMWPDAEHEPVARSHRLPCAGAPALDGNGGHEGTPSAAAIELRRVFQSEASRKRAKQASIAASAGAFSCKMNSRTRSLPSVAS